MAEPTQFGRWRKSSYSANEANCVEVSGNLDGLRDSKNVDGPVLRVDLRAFLTAIKEGRAGR
ncbi:MAG TPA: DUF397 domain-containing protein [Pseudonocardiaceae bacterium]|jgi:hypothetical protein|nr:DUF397 domain-containing protein [Pseudonocardiaceae bacterium]